jgi:hypothetical protein
MSVQLVVFKFQLELIAYTMQGPFTMIIATRSMG